MKTFTEKELAQYWCQLNRFELLGLKTDHKETMGAMRFIQTLIGHKACMKEWNSGKVPGAPKP